jgi:hypothetical protein
MSDTAYLRKRAAHELRAAVEATDYRVRKAHLELANAYSARLCERQAEQQR